MPLAQLLTLVLSSAWPLCHGLALADLPSFEQRCLSFMPERYIYNSSRTVLEYVAAGTNLTFPDNDPSCARESQVINTNLCRVALSIPTSPRSSITYEHWFPESWSGRYLATGNGGIDGCIKYEDIAYGTQYGFATTGTNNGHNGTSGKAFYQNADVVTDYSWRSLHTSVLAGKNLTDLFYGEPHTTSYFIGCSGGGRQGFKSADMFPTGEFSGIVAGCPGLDFNNLYSWRATFYPITGPANSTDFITPATWTQLIHAEVLKQCDSIDGVMDGIITDPDLCHFKPETLLCSSPDDESSSTNGTCLNANQVKQVQKIFSPYVYPNGTLIYPAMQPGSEEMAIGRLYAGAPFSYSEDWFRYVVLEDLSWDPLTFNVSDAALANTLNPANVRTYPSDLSAFRDSGSKLIAYHGRQDNQISSFNTERFYDHLSEEMNASATDLDSFFRFFRIPGMFHCGAGPGAWVVGQGGGASAAGIPFEASNNVLAAIVAWVENGTAPDVIQGTKFVNDTVRLGVDYTRNHCRYPLRSTYIGGDPKAVESWECQTVGDSKTPR